VLLAGGRGTRSGLDYPKQYKPLAGQSAVRRCLRALSGGAGIGPIQPVIHPDDRALYLAAAEGISTLPPVPGGATRQDSVLAGLEALAPSAPRYVLVHDAARPFLSPALIARALSAVAQCDAAIPALPVTDTVKSVDADEIVTKTLDRGTLRYVQTPQAFAFAPLLAAHWSAAAKGLHDFSDDAGLAEWAGIPVRTFAGDAANIKLTTPDDFVRAETMLQDDLSDIRTGMGYDVHAFGPGDHVMLGGVAIPHDRGLTGHSDADVVLHALVDAILGALADGDIGAHFPPSDPKWRGAASDVFLKFAMERVAARGGMVAHLDSTIVCEAPKIGPHRDAIRTQIAAIAGLPLDRVAVKATTSEQLGFTGRREGIAAYAAATVRLPWSTGDAG
jgi:2-C-methyl-D-erythritol 4-phosphate cytidylyltransferase / 2-C-methyl-D-erythritol 2,4-cyclodiphosphate synthase